MKEIIEQLKKSPESHLEPSVITDRINKWSDPPKAIEVLRTLDACVNLSLASTIVIMVMEMLLDKCCKQENVLYADLVKTAPWRLGTETV